MALYSDHIISFPSAACKSVPLWAFSTTGGRGQQKWGAAMNTVRNMNPWGKKKMSQVERWGGVPRHRLFG